MLRYKGAKGGVSERQLSISVESKVTPPDENCETVQLTIAENNRPWRKAKSHCSRKAGGVSFRATPRRFLAAAVINLHALTRDAL